MLQQLARNVDRLLGTYTMPGFKALRGVYDGTASRNPSRQDMRRMLVLGVFMATAGIGGCAMGIENSSERSGEHGSEGDSEHAARNAGQDNVRIGEAEGEESGGFLTLDETYDTVRKGARLIIGYHAADHTFVGTVENTTSAILLQVRVEVHLSNGVELGPTTPVDLLPGQTTAVSLKAATEPFDGWTPHAEVGAGEHGTAGSEDKNNREHDIEVQDDGATRGEDETASRSP